MIVHEAPINAHRPVQIVVLNEAAPYGLIHVCIVNLLPCAPVTFGLGLVLGDVGIHSMRKPSRYTSEILQIAMAMSLCLLLVGGIVARNKCRSGSLQWDACTWLKKSGVQLGPLLRF